MKRRTNRPSRSSSKRKLEGSPTLQDYNEPINAAPSAHEIIDRSVKRSGLGYEGFVKHLTQTALSSLCIWSEDDLKRLLVAAERLGLDPLNNEIYAVQGGEDPTSPVLLVVSLNGWARILNANPAFDGMHFTESACVGDAIPDWIECTIHRKDRSFPTTVREYLCEVRGEQGAWLTHPRRMLRHKAMVQCARVCFGLVGIHDPDEAARARSARDANGPDNKRRSAPPTHKVARPSDQASLKSLIRGLGTAT